MTFTVTIALASAVVGLALYVTVRYFQVLRGTADSGLEGRNVDERRTIARVLEDPRTADVAQTSAQALTAYYVLSGDTWTEGAGLTVVSPEGIEGVDSLGDLIPDLLEPMLTGTAEGVLSGIGAGTGVGLLYRGGKNFFKAASGDLTPGEALGDAFHDSLYVSGGGLAGSIAAGSIGVLLLPIAGPFAPMLAGPIAPVLGGILGGLWGGKRARERKLADYYAAKRRAERAHERFLDSVRDVARSYAASAREIERLLRRGHRETIRMLGKEIRAVGGSTLRVLLFPNPEAESLIRERHGLKKHFRTVVLPAHRRRISELRSSSPADLLSYGSAFASNPGTLLGMEAPLAAVETASSARVAYVRAVENANDEAERAKRRLS